MKYFVVLFIAFFCGFSQAADIAQLKLDKDTVVVLTDVKCGESPTYQVMIMQKNKVFAQGCWFLHGVNMIALWNDGAMDVAPIKEFSWISDKKYGT
jgi:hypothetical protein